MRRIITILAVAGLQVGILGGTPWTVQSQERTSPQEEKTAAATVEDEDTKFQESLNSLGLSAGYAIKCNEKEAGAVETIAQQALEVGNQLVEMFGTDRAFRFVFYTGIGAAGSKLDTAKCPQYITEWANIMKRHPEIDRALIKEKK